MTTPNNGGDTQKDGGWEEEFNLFWGYAPKGSLKSCKGDEIKSFIHKTLLTHEAQVRDEIRKMVEGMGNRYRCGACDEDVSNLAHTMLCDAFDDILTRLQTKNQEV